MILFDICLWIWILLFLFFGVTLSPLLKFWTCPTKSSSFVGFAYYSPIHSTWIKRRMGDASVISWSVNPQGSSYWLLYYTRTSILDPKKCDRQYWLNPFKGSISNPLPTVAYDDHKGKPRLPGSATLPRRLNQGDRKKWFNRMMLTKNRVLSQLT